jgi:hypothetical protein
MTPSSRATSNPVDRIQWTTPAVAQSVVGVRGSGLPAGCRPCRAGRRQFPGARSRRVDRARRRGAQCPCLRGGRRVGLDDAGRRQPGVPVGADLAGANQVSERRDRLLEIRARIEGVHLVQVDVVGAESPERVLDGPHDPAAGCPRWFGSSGSIGSPNLVASTTLSRRPVIAPCQPHLGGLPPRDRRPPRSRCDPVRVLRARRGAGSPGGPLHRLRRNEARAGSRAPLRGSRLQRPARVLRGARRAGASDPS